GETCFIIWRGSHVFVAPHTPTEPILHQPVFPQDISELTIGTNQYVHAIIAPRQLALHLNTKGTLKNENFYNRLLRRIQSERVAPCLRYCVSMKQPGRCEVKQTASNILERRIVIYTRRSLVRCHSTSRQFPYCSVHSSSVTVE